MGLRAYYKSCNNNFSTSLGYYSLVHFFELDYQDRHYLYGHEKIMPEKCGSNATIM